MESTSSSTGLQQTGVDALSTGDPQQGVQGGLQPQAGSELQPSSPQTIDSINALDQGNKAISLTAITNTTATTAPPASTPVSYTKIYVYGAITIICGAILGYILYSSLKKRS